jgi:predicted ArsR family transcriptional regulator
VQCYGWVMPTPDQRSPTGPDPAPLQADLAMMKALSNPVRQQILTELRRTGPMTSTTLARQLGITTGGTSYNLRMLAKFGLVEEVDSEAKGRERWWRAKPHDVRLPARTEQGGPEQQARDAVLRSWLEADEELIGRFLQHREQAGEWADVMPYSRGAVQVSVDELNQFFEEYLALMKRYQRGPEDRTADVRQVEVRFIAIPQ